MICPLSGRLKKGEGDRQAGHISNSTRVTKNLKKAHALAHICRVLYFLFFISIVILDKNYRLQTSNIKEEKEMDEIVFFSLITIDTTGVVKESLTQCLLMI